MRHAGVEYLDHRLSASSRDPRDMQCNPRGIDPRRVLMASAAPATVVPAVARALAPQAAIEVASPLFGAVVVEYLAKQAVNWTGGLD